VLVTGDRPTWACSITSFSPPSGMAANIRTLMRGSVAFYNFFPKFSAATTIGSPAGGSLEHQLLFGQGRGNPSPAPCRQGRAKDPSTICHKRFCSSSLF